MRTTRRIALIPCKRLLVLLCCACSPAMAGTDAQRLEFDFAQADHSFTAGFADYPVNYVPASYRLTSSWSARPENLGGAPALFISGVNHSDDLFMFWKRKITGLPASTEMLLTMEIEFASKYRTGLVGVGGAPGDSVVLKAGVVNFEPLAVLPRGETHYRMNLDKDSGGNQFGGADMPTIGTIAKPDDGNNDYVLLTKHQHGQPRGVTTAADGSLWLIFGTDSGFEAETALYYTRLIVWLNRADTPHLWLEPANTPGMLRLIWNQGTLRGNDDLGSEWPAVPVTSRPHLHDALSAPRGFWRVAQP
jgi:hypothetical protein